MDGGSSGGSAKQKSQRNKRRAALMKKLGIERTTYRCCNCYRIVACEGPKSRNTHIPVCPGGTPPRG